MDDVEGEGDVLDTTTTTDRAMVEKERFEHDKKVIASRIITARTHIKRKAMVGSKWATKMSNYTTSSSEKRAAICSTLFTGGVFRGDAAQYLSLLSLKAIDISNGVKMTDNEIATGKHRMFFEVDIRDDSVTCLRDAAYH